MPLIMIMRHAQAEPPGTGPDPERRLTAEGVNQARRISRSLSLKPSIVYTSPYARARETASIIAREHQVDVKVVEELSPAQASLESLARLNPPDSALVVGHNPSVERIVSTLTGCTVTLSPGALAIVFYASRIAPGSGMLKALLDPQYLADKSEK